MSKKKKQQQGKGPAKSNNKTSQPLDQAILKFVSKQRGSSLTWQKVVKKFLRQHSKDKIVNTITHLVKQGKLVKHDGNKLSVPKSQKKHNKGSGNKGKNVRSDETYEGTVDMTMHGYAFVICPEREEDVYISERNLKTALDGDKVRIRLTRRRRNGRYDGEVLEVLERKQTQFIGTIHLSKNFAFLVTDKSDMHWDIFIPSDKIHGAKEHEKAIAKILDWPDDGKNPVGEIVETLGEAGLNEVEMKSILLENGFNLNFPDSVMNQAEHIPEKIPEKEIKKRLDLRDVTTFTIDPDDAKDFDDALSLRKLENGNWEVGVHIADVSHYVQPDSALDKEAYERATSVYLVDRVLPMLPEKLSNKVCSLRPNEDKLTFSALFEIDIKAKVHSAWFGRTVICSDKRFTYADAQSLIDGNDGELKDEVNTLNNMARIIRKQRFEDGSIGFESSEVKFKLDKNAKPIGVELKVMRESNQLIEEFMLLANKYVAKFLSKLKAGKGQMAPSIYRVHDTPDQFKLELFTNFAKKFGYNVKFQTPKQTAAALNDLFKMIKGRNEQSILEQLAIRSMAKAVYTTENIGHYGLAFEHYTHFTSPIRRYPDVLVHRLLQEALTTKKALYDQDLLEEMAQHCSEQERSAMTAERDSVKYKQVEYLSERIGEVYDGVIVGVISAGIFVELVDNKCEGFISIRNLGEGEFEFDEANFALVDGIFDEKFQLGDRLTVKVAATNLEKRQVDLALADKDNEED